MIDPGLLGLSPDATFDAAPQGMTSDVMFVDDGGRRLVLKRCRDPHYLEWLHRERGVLAALAESRLPAPRLVAAGDDWILMTRLPGESLWSAILRSSPDRRTLLFAALGSLLRLLHATPVPVAFGEQRPWFERKLALARRNLSWCEGSAGLLEELARTLPPEREETLIHGDLALDNVLVAPDGTMSLIDWSTGDAGDPRCDLALVLDTEPELPLHGADIDAFFGAYGAAPLDAATAQWFRRLHEFF